MPLNLAMITMSNGCSPFWGFFNFHVGRKLNEQSSAWGTILSAIQLLKKNDEKTSYETNIALALQTSWVTSTESESGYVWPGKLDYATCGRGDLWIRKARMICGFKNIRISVEGALIKSKTAITISEITASLHM